MSATNSCGPPFDFTLPTWTETEVDDCALVTLNDTDGDEVDPVASPESAGTNRAVSGWMPAVRKGGRVPVAFPPLTGADPITVLPSSSSTVPAGAPCRLSVTVAVQVDGDWVP